MRSLLRVRRFYHVQDLIMLYKSHVLSYIEYRTSGIYHASSTVLADIENIQARFLSQFAISAEDALMRFNLAPLCVRRDIAILGMIHRAVLRMGPPHLWQFFYINLLARTPSLRRPRHNMQLAECPAMRDLDLMRRSALGAIRVYNLLPQLVVDTRSVSSFQTQLTTIVKARVVARDERWTMVLSPRWPFFDQHPLISDL